jgi:hypothetical protein
MYRKMLQITLQYQPLICFTGMLKEAKMIVTVILPLPKDSIMYRLEKYVFFSVKHRPARHKVDNIIAA